MTIESEQGRTTGAPAGRGQRVTRQKLAVASLLDATNEFSSAQELHARLRTSGVKVGLTTVYTQLRSLEESGEIDSVRSDNGEVLYRRCQRGSHHHHLVCRRCGRAIEVDAPEVEAWAQQLAADYRFAEVDHVLEITGVCDRCA